MSWLVYKRGTIEPFRAYLPLFGVYKYFRHDIGASQPRTLYINEGDKLHWSWEKESFYKFNKKLLNFLENPRRLKSHFFKLDKVAELALKDCRDLIKMDLSRLSNKELISRHKQLMSAVTPAHFIFNMEIDVVDVCLEDFVKKKIAKELAPDVRQLRLDEIFTVLTRPICLTYVNKMDIEINRLALKKDLSETAIKRAHAKFWWTNLGWENMQPYSLKDFLDLIKSRAKLRDLKSRLDHAEDFIKNNRQERFLYFKKFNLSPAVKYWLEICDKYIFYHDKRKELQVISTYSARLVLREIARRHKLKMDDLEWLWHFEAMDILRGKPVDQAEIMARKKCIAALVSYQSFKSWSGLAAQKIKDRHVSENAAHVRELKGRGVEGGLIRARVKVCAGAVEALAKVKRGDILVCPMTLPDYLPAMKRARAIITEEGGVTCHAAIIAREFKIPCIVGTKIATEVLRDGDLIEVNANHGWIRKIK